MSSHDVIPEKPLLPTPILEAIEKEGYSDFEGIEQIYVTVRGTDNLHVTFSPYFAEKVAKRKRYFEASTLTPEELYEMIKVFIPEGTQVVCVCQAGHWRSKDLSRVINEHLPYTSEAFSGTDMVEFSKRIFEFLSLPPSERKLTPMFFFYDKNKMHEPLELMQNLFMIMFKYIETYPNSTISNIFNENYMSILEGDLSSIGFDLYMIQQPHKRQSFYGSN
jgi:hypothetical protein